MNKQCKINRLLYLLKTEAEMYARIGPTSIVHQIKDQQNVLAQRAISTSNRRRHFEVEKALKNVTIFRRRIVSIKDELKVDSYLTRKLSHVTINL